MKRILPVLDWDGHYMSEAYLWARKSKDLRTQVGAVIVGPDNDDRTRGYNGPLRGLDDNDPSIYEKPLSGGPSPFMEHAERNAIFNAARLGLSAKDCTMYVTLMPCDNCARAIVNSGIKSLVLPNNAPSFLNEVQQMGLRILKKSGIGVRYWNGTPLISHVLFDGEIIDTGVKYVG
jgi:dCMP deaminase